MPTGPGSASGSAAQLRNLRPLVMREMQPGVTHRGHLVSGRTCTPATKVAMGAQQEEDKQHSMRGLTSRLRQDCPCVPSLPCTSPPPLVLAS